MRKTAIQLINEKYQTLFGGTASSGISAVEKLETISRCVDSGPRIFFLEDDDQQKRALSEEVFFNFLVELAGASFSPDEQLSFNRQHFQDLLVMLSGSDTDQNTINLHKKMKKANRRNTGYLDLSFDHHEISLLIEISSKNKRQDLSAILRAKYPEYFQEYHLQETLKMLEEIMRSSNSDKKLLLEILKNDFFKEKANIKKFLSEYILKKGFFSYDSLVSVFSSEENKVVNRYAECYRVLVFEIGPKQGVFAFGGEVLPAEPAKNETAVNHHLMPMLVNELRSSSGFVSEFSPKGSSKNTSAERNRTSTQSDCLSSLVVPGSVKKKSVSFHNEPSAQDAPVANKLLDEYIAMRDIKTTCSLTFFRNIPHNDTLTKEKVARAKTLRKAIETANNNKEIILLLLEEKKWNQEAQKKEHTFWLRNEGEYGKHLAECLTLVSLKIGLDDIDKFMREGFPKTFDSSPIGSVDQALLKLRMVPHFLPGGRKKTLSVLEEVKKAQEASNQVKKKESSASLRR